MPMLSIHLRRLFQSREFGALMLLSLLLAFIPAAIYLLTLSGKYLEEVAPNWVYVNTVEAVIESPIKMVNQIYIVLIAPFAGSICYGAFFYDDHINHIDLLLMSRGGKRKYWLSGTVVVFLSGFVIVFLSNLLWRGMLYLGIPAESLKYPVNGSAIRGDELIAAAIFSELQVTKPYAYAFLYSVLPALYSGLLAVASLGCSMVFRKKRTFHLLAPGLSLLVVSFIAALLPFNIPQIQYLLIPQVADSPGLRVAFVVFFPLLVLTDALLLVLGAQKNKDVL